MQLMWGVDPVLYEYAKDEVTNTTDVLKKLDTQNINNVVIDAWNKESLLKVQHIYYGETRAFALAPRVGNWSEIQELAENIFDLNKKKNYKNVSLKTPFLYRKKIHKKTVFRSIR
jgi:lactate dehydrogenase-like 2-hydroxyacid dehydrogenase